jgi:amino acid transporter
MIQSLSSSIKELVIGKPLSTDDAQHQAISKKVGLAVFASDALSSVAYATQEILVVLVGAVVLLAPTLAGGSAAAERQVFPLAIPIAAAIALLLLILTISYRQTIFAYPDGGGAYTVSRDNFGPTAGMVAAAALLIDYILTVSVSVSSGVAQIASAFPAILPYRAEVAIAIVIVITVINLRGVKESGAVFAVPTYGFIILMLLTMGTGVVKALTGTLGTVPNPPELSTALHGAETLGLFLILKAFSSGCAALTGVEAISNGIQAFKEPRSRNAANTLLVMSGLLGVLFIGTTLLATATQAVPSESETVISQIARTVFGQGTILYGALVFATTMILVVAANTSFADFPRLSALAARDGYVPRQLGVRGSRLVFNYGIVALAGASCLLIFVFDAEVTRLIPLYAIGVFLSFTLSQSGMVMRWIRSSRLKPGEAIETPGHTPLHFDKGWRWKMAVNALGATLTFIVMIVFAIAKFSDGAWAIVLLIPLLVFAFYRTHRHYRDVARILSTKYEMERPSVRPMRTIILVDDVHRGTHQLVEFAKSIGQPWLAAHVAINPIKSEVVQRKWHERIGEGELHILSSPYRQLTAPIVDFVLQQRDMDPSGFVQVIMGQLIMDTPQARILHANSTLGIMAELQRHDRIVVTDVPYQLHGMDAEKFPANVLGETTSHSDVHIAHEGSHSA